jgi:steroid 5-alpha reductase family enzyme
MTGPATLTELIAWAFAAMMVLMLAAWLGQMLARNSGWIDAVWTFGTGLACVAVALWPLDGDEPFAPRALIAAVLAGVWALRLGLYITARVARSAEDARYAEFRQVWGKSYQLKLLLLVLAQPVVSAVLALAVALAARAPDPYLGLRDLIAVAVWIVAIFGETLADLQMARFKADPANRGGICDRGLWAWSRHPNYFFEWLVWWAYPIMAISPDAPASWLSLGAPVVMFLILRFVSGVPPLEKSMLASRGEAFRAYQARVSAFIPLPPRRAKPGAQPSET